MLKVAACIRDGVVVNVAEYDEDTSGAWLDAVRADFDEVRVLDAAAIGWTVEEEGLRVPPPFPSWTWDGTAWQPPVPHPDDENVYAWDEDSQTWATVDPISKQGDLNGSS